MLDVRKIRNKPEEVKAALLGRSKAFDVSIIDEIVEQDEKRRLILVEVENLKGKKNIVSSEIPKLKKAGQNVNVLMAEMKKIGDNIKEFDLKVAEIDEKIKFNILRIPNLPNESVPEGTNEKDNLEVRKWGEPTSFSFEPKAHWDLGVNLNILDFERAGKITGSRFTIYKGLGARLERAIINYFLRRSIKSCCCF